MSVTLLADAKAYLNIVGNDHDGEVQSTLNRAEGMIAARVGPLSQGSVTERVRPSAGQLRLTQLPVASLTSIVDADGAAVDTDGWVVGRSGVADSPYGVLMSRYYDVTYMAGHGSPLPAGIAEGVLAMTAHLWNTQRGPQRRPGALAVDRQANTTPGAAYVWPFRVTEAIADYLLVGV